MSNTVESPWGLHSRVHLLNHFPHEFGDCYVKRDDELACGISGTKLRKYASLVPALLAKGTKRLVIIAGTNSNNLLSALQVARENQWQVTAFLLKPWSIENKGNFKLSRMFLNEEDIKWIDRNDWFRVEELAQQYINEQTEKCFLLTEGASVREAMAGAESLAHDIVCNEKTLDLQFAHIFIDSGTGFSAIALIKAMYTLNHPAIIHVLLLADDEKLFKQKIQGLFPGCDGSYKKLINFHCFYPTNAKSFGAVNATVKKEIKRMAYEEGILVDPIYSAKLFFEARKKILANNLPGNKLIIHSGGTLSLMGFYSVLE